MTAAPMSPLRRALLALGAAGAALAIPVAAVTATSDHTNLVSSARP